MSRKSANFVDSAVLCACVYRFGSQVIPLLAGSLSGSGMFMLCAVLAWISTLLFQFENRVPDDHVLEGDVGDKVTPRVHM